MDKIKEEVRLIIAFALAIIIIMVFGRIQAKHAVIPVQKKPAGIASETESETSAIQPGTVPESTDRVPEKTGRTIEYDDGRYILGINPENGSISSIGIRKYQRKGEDFFSILEGTSLLADSALQNGNHAYKADLDRESGKIVLTGPEDGAMQVEKSIILPGDNHTFSAIIRISGPKAAMSEPVSYTMEAGSMQTAPPNRRGGKEFTPPEILLRTPEETVRLNPARLKGETFYKKTEWIALKQGYSLLFVKPGREADGFVRRQENRVTYGFKWNDLAFSGKNTEEISISFYAGPSDYFVAKSEIEEKEVFGSGFFASMGRFLFQLLSYIHRVVPNWGWAIIILTLIIKILFFPLTKNSLKSMKSLQKLRPYLQEIQKKYKDNPQQMQKEMMSLYKDYKINPLGGCIPMLLQFPIFIGFFLALRSSIFFRGATFGLWIRDLSVPDTIAQFGGFNLNLLPVLMAATSFFQQKLTPQEPSQKTLTYMMPVMFLFLFYNFSSGLLLYWVTMNLAGLVEQYFIHKK